MGRKFEECMLLILGLSETMLKGEREMRFGGDYRS